MQKAVVALISVGLLTILFAPLSGQVQQASADGHDCGALRDDTNCEEQLVECLEQNSGIADLDGDRLADDVEVCFLGTDPLEKHTDGDNIIDGEDATPEADEMQPLKLRVFKIKQIYPDPICDAENRWDLYFSLINLEVPNLQLVTDFDYNGWTLASHDHDHGYNWFKITDDVENVNGGSASGSNVELQLDPDMTEWDGLEEMKLRLDGALTLADHDAEPHYENGNDDFMELNFDGKDILKINQPVWDFDTDRAYDQDDDEMDCQARIRIRNDFVGLDANVLSVGDALMTTSAGIINCQHALVYGCDIGTARQKWSQ